MINISDSLRKSLESFGDDKSLRISLEILDITSDLISQNSVSLKQGLSSKDNYSIGNTICSEIKFSIINNANKYTSMSFYNKNITVELDINTKSGEKLTLGCGKYICQRPKITNSGKIEITGYDYMLKFEVNSDKFLNTLTYPITLVEFMRKACEYVGIEHNIPDNITNANFQIKGRPESQKYTIRELMGMALSIAGGNGRINIENNKFEVAYLTESGYTIPDSVHFNSVEIDDYQIAQIGCVVASNKENTDIIYGDRDSFVYYMDSNELIYNSTDEEIVNMLGNVLPRLANIDYKPFNINIMRGLVFLQPGDIISYYYNGKEYKAPIFERTLTGIYQQDNLAAAGTEDRDRLRETSVSSGQVSGIASSGYDKYTLTATKRYLDANGENIVAMGMYHSNIDKELIFKPNIFNGAYIGMQTNFQDDISNTDLVGVAPDMTRIDKD